MSGVHHRRLPRHGIHHEVEHRHHLLAFVQGPQQVVHALHHDPRTMSLEAERAHRHANLPHHARRLDPVAGHVTDHERDAAVGKLDHVVPVTTGRRALLGRHVPGREAHPDEVREPLGEQCLLERVGDPVLTLQLASLGDVLDRPDHPHHRPIRGSDGARLPVERPRVRVLTDDPILDVRDHFPPLLDGTNHVGLDTSSILGHRELDGTLERDGRIGREAMDPIHLEGPVHDARRHVPIPRTEM